MNSGQPYFAKIVTDKKVVKTAFFVALLLTSTSFVLCFITVQIMNNYILNEIIKRGESVSTSIAASAGYSLLPRDLLSLDNLVFKAKPSNNDMEYVAIVTSDIKAFSEETALQEIVRVAGNQLRADLVVVFVGLTVKSNIHDEAVSAGRAL